MLDHLSIGVRDLAASRAFYDAVLAPLGYRCLHETADSVGYGSTQAQFWLGQTDSPVPADHRSGLHFCFSAPDRASVERFHQAALAAGGTDNGAPGFRPEYAPDYYAAFVIDPTGYRIEAYCSATR
jgi:catechol 2,3-dioxygenase-like lactoylglutathione lyase family enzyme